MRYYRYLQRYLPVGLFTLWSLKLLIISPSLAEVLALAVVAAVASVFHYKRAQDLSAAESHRIQKLEHAQVALKDELSSTKIGLGFKRRE